MFNKNLFACLLTVSAFFCGTLHASNDQQPTSPKNRTCDPYYDPRQLSSLDDVEQFAGTIVKIAGTKFYTDKKEGYTSPGGSKFCYVTKDMLLDGFDCKYIPVLILLNPGESGGKEKFTELYLKTDKPWVKRLDATEIVQVKQALARKQALFDMRAKDMQKYNQEITEFLTVVQGRPKTSTPPLVTVVRALHKERQTNQS